MYLCRAGALIRTQGNRSASRFDVFHDPCWIGTVQHLGRDLVGRREDHRGSPGSACSIAAEAPVHLALMVALLAALAAANCANDVSKGVATLVGSGVTRYRTAIL